MPACEWPILYSGCPEGDCADIWTRWPTSTREEMKQAHEQAAVDLLWNWTGGVFGVCTEAIRPCRTGCDGNAEWASTFWGRGPGMDPGFPRLGSGFGGAGFYPVLVSGKWFNISCGCLSGCRCAPSGPAVLSLPGPVVEVSTVTIDGEEVPAESYRLDQGRWLIRVDGGVWPGCQDMNVAPDEPGSFVVTYQRGVPVPVGGQIAAGRLARELAMADCGDENCGLPDNWQNLTRQGLSISLNPEEAASQRTGIWIIDDWVDSVNRPKPFASVRSVDIPSLR